ncbi:MAG: hypothetical protein ABJF10_19430 [Chthoniobacter sp.]|uniref:hypothetical protein n=1 Tax=Chthoniobacter sp. TaxID=2510640 RepID=UPI0032A931A1
MLIRKYAPAAAIAFVLWALWLLWLWQPERQVRLHTTHFLKKVERRNWEGARVFLADDFTDRWAHDKNSALEDAKQVFSQFLFLTIENRTDNCDIRGTAATTRTRVKISGNGSAITQMVMERVNGLREPFVFTWRKAGSAPWDWQLTHIDQPELSIDPNVSF